MRLALTRRGDYGVRAMLALGRAGGARLSTPVMAAAMNIPVRFLPQVMGDLNRAGLVRSRAGRQGGYELARPPETISLLTIIEAVEGNTPRRTCVLRGGPCRRAGVCEVHQVFGSAQDALRGQLAAVSLGSLSTPAQLADARPGSSANLRRSNAVSRHGVACVDPVVRRPRQRPR